MKSLTGKVPPEILETIIFKHLGVKDENVILGPSKGEDAAIVKVDENFLAISCDPISGAVRKVGWVSVHITCNDIATRGIEPKWFLGCLMLPEKTDRKSIREICTQMGKAARNINVSIIGGHSEFTPNLAHPLIIGFSAGVIDGQRYVTSSGARPGDKILLTKSVGIEGTAILASDRYEELASKLGKKLVNNAARYIERISVVRDALIAAKYVHVHAMHDPTEGGIAGGLNELADASNVGFRIYEDKIPIQFETREICRVLKIDPLRLISSGALLICVDKRDVKLILDKFRRRRIQSSVIGEILADKSVRTVTKKDGRIVPLTTPLQDELWNALTKTSLHFRAEG